MGFKLSRSFHFPVEDLHSTADPNTGIVGIAGFYVTSPGGEHPVTIIAPIATLRGGIGTGNAGTGAVKFSPGTNSFYLPNVATEVHIMVWGTRLGVTTNS